MDSLDYLFEKVKQVVEEAKEVKEEKGAVPGRESGAVNL